jgi:uncharacterized membrane protein (TIGR02234 family)
MNRSAVFASALLLDLIGAAGALLVATRHWQTVTTPRPAPLRDDVLDLSGRTVDAAPTALALVALAGVVAVLATRGVARRVVGLILALAGAGLIWQAVAAADAVSAARARSLVSEHHATVAVSSAVPRVVTHPVWPALTVVAGVLVLGAGLLVAWRGHRWQVMSTRYEARPSQDSDPARTAATLWTELDRGADPTD